MTRFEFRAADGHVCCSTDNPSNLCADCKAKAHATAAPRQAVLSANSRTPSSVTILKGESSDLLQCRDDIGTFYVVVPTGNTDTLRSAADWAAYFAAGVFHETVPSRLRAAYQREHIPDGYLTALSRGADALKPSPRFATGHTGAPDGYAASLPVVNADVDEHDGYAVALSHRATVHQFPTSIDGYAAALANRKES